MLIMLARMYNILYMEYEVQKNKTTCLINLTKLVQDEINGVVLVKDEFCP